jgi:hypothetical protein
MVSLKGICTVACKGDKRTCWHTDCIILKQFTSGKFLIENANGYVRAAASTDLLFSVSDENKYNKYNMKFSSDVDDVEERAEAEREQIRQTRTDSLKAFTNNLIVNHKI